MPAQNVLRWKDGQGWLVLSGGNDPSSEVRAIAIERIAAEQLLACLTFSSDPAEGDAILNDMQDLGAPSGYIVNLLTEDDDSIRKQIEEAGIIVLSSNLPVNEIRSCLLGVAAEALLTAYERGAVILAEEQAANVFGAYVFQSDKIVDGLDWVLNGFIAPGVISVAESTDVQQVINQQEDVIVVGIGIGSALALSGAGQVETWGQKQITLALGRAYTKRGL